MTAQPFDVAIAGCGRIAGGLDAPNRSGDALTHAQAYRRHPAFRLRAVCDPDHDRLAAFRDAWQVPASYASLEELLNEQRPAVVSICSRTDQHFPMLTELLQREDGLRVVFVEKPVCQQRAEWAELTQLAAARDSMAIVVNHTRRFDPAHRQVQALVASGVLGSLLHGRCQYYGGWINNGSHLVDTLRMWLGPLAIEGARPSCVRDTRHGDRCLDVTLRAAGAPVDVRAFDETYYQVFEIELFFEGGRVIARDFGREIVVEEARENQHGERCLVPLPGTPWRGLGPSLLEAVGAIADHLDGRDSLRRTGATLADAGETMALLWEAQACL